MLKSWPLEHVNVKFANTIFEEGLNLRWSHTGWVGPKSSDGVVFFFFFLKESDLETQLPREGGSVTMEAETGVMHLQANEARKRQGRILPRALRKNMPPPKLPWFHTSSLQDSRRVNFCWFNQFVVICYRSPRKVMQYAMLSYFILCISLYMEISYYSCHLFHVSVVGTSTL